MESWAFWRRIDVPGQDACRLWREPGGDWRLAGTAVFHDGVPSVIDYAVVCDPSWVTRSARLRGWRGSVDVRVEIQRSADGEWTLDERPMSDLRDCLDVDLGFTPATNVIQLRRTALAVGAVADAPSAWFDVASLRLERLEQRYERRSPTAYWYEAPQFDYAALLEVRSDGFVRDYPGLWKMES